MLNSKNKSLFFFCTDPKICEKDNRPMEAGALRSVTYPFNDNKNGKANICDL